MLTKGAKAVVSPGAETPGRHTPHHDTTLSRAKFEELCDDLISRCQVPVENALRDAKLSLSDMDEVILVGGGGDEREGDGGVGGEWWGGSS